MTPDRARIAVAFHSPFYAPIHVAHRLGTFADEGLDARLVVPPPGGTVDMIQTGGADVALSGVMRSLVLADRGGPRLIAIAEVNSRDGFFVLARRPVDGFAWRDLEGRRLALFGLAPTPWMCLQMVLRENGVDPGKVTAIEGLDPAAGAAALERGDVDYLQTAQPLVDELVDDGRVGIAAAQAPDVGHVPYSSLIVTDDVRRSRPELCRRVVSGLTRALRWMAAHDADAIADVIAPEFRETRPAILRRVVARYKAAGTWSDGPRQACDAFARLARALVAGGLIRRAAEYDALVDDTFAQRALRGMSA